MKPLVYVCALIALSGLPTHAQWFSPQQGGMWGQAQGGFGQAQGGFGQAQGGWGQGGQSMQPEEYETCIGKNTNGDELRVTFSTSSGSRNSWANPWGRGGREMRVNSVLSSGQSSNMMGAFQLVVTTGSRVEEGCMSEALGDILGDNNQPMFNAMFGRQQRRTRRGVIGNPIFISPGKSATSSETIDNFTMRELRGRGLALCRAEASAGDRCYGLIPLCCKIGTDSQPATTPFYMQGQFMGQGGFGMQGNGMMGGVMGGGMGGGMGGMGGMGGINSNQGLTVGLPQGMNQGAPPQGINPALPQNLPGSINTGGTASGGLF